MNWKQKIEAQIEELRCAYCTEDAETMQALLDVAVAAEEQQARLSTTPAWKWMQGNEYTIALGDAICKLRGEPYDAEAEYEDWKERHVDSDDIGEFDDD